MCQRAPDMLGLSRRDAGVTTQTDSNKDLPNIQIHAFVSSCQSTSPLTTAELSTPEAKARLSHFVCGSLFSTVISYKLRKTCKYTFSVKFRGFAPISRFFPLLSTPGKFLGCWTDPLVQDKYIMNQLFTLGGLVWVASNSSHPVCMCFMAWRRSTAM